jgi:hypothetical protein
LAYPTGWGRYFTITIDHTKVAADATDYPLYLAAGNFNTESRDADGSYPALNGGGDLRFSSDSAGTTRLPCEVVSFVTNNDPTLATAEVHVKVASVSSSTDTVIYCWYNKAGETQPAVTDTYGRNAVWESNYKAVYHMTDASTTSISDSTSNGLNLTKASAGNPNSDTGKVGESQYFSGASTDYLYSANDVLDGIASGSVQMWYNPYDKEQYYHLFSYGSSATNFVMLGFFGTSAGAYSTYAQSYQSPNNASRTTNGTNSNVFRHICWKSSGSAWSAFYNGGAAETLVLVAGAPAGDWFDDRSSGTSAINIGRSQLSNYYGKGWIDEIRISLAQFSEQRNNTDYQNQNAPTTFSAPGAGVTPGGTTAIKDLICSGIIPFAR